MAQQTAAATPARTRRPRVRTGGVFLSFLPWIIFSFVASPSTWEYAALAGLIASVVLSGQDLLHGKIRVLDVTAIVFFGVLCVLALFLDRGDLRWLETYAQVISYGLVAVVALGSLLVDPFTAQYARETVPREVWNSPVFQHINRVLTTLWCVVFAVLAVSTWMAVRNPSQDDWFNWVIPIALLVLAVKVTQQYPESYKARARG